MFLVIINRVLLTQANWRSGQFGKWGINHDHVSIIILMIYDNRPVKKLQYEPM